MREPKKSSKNFMQQTLTPLRGLILLIGLGVLTAFLIFLHPAPSDTLEDTAPLSDVTVAQRLRAPDTYQSGVVIDLSGWQSPEKINYTLLSKHIIGAIVRVQSGVGPQKADTSSDKEGEDTQFKVHMTQFQRQGIPVAVYAYVTGKTVAQMQAQAKAFYARAVAYHPTYWFLDVEEYTMPIGYMNEGLAAYIAELKTLGVSKIGLYSTAAFIKSNQITTSPYSAFWLADYGANTGTRDSSPQTTLAYQLHQYTSVGRLAGYSGDLDLSRVTSEAAYSHLFLGN